MKSVVLLGATGSIGKNTLDVIREHRDKFYLKGISSTGSNPGLIKWIVDEFKPEFVATVNPIDIKGPFKIIEGTNCNERLVEEVDADIFVIALSGIDGILPTYRAVKKGKRVALANKESIVSAGRIIVDTAKKSGAEIIPIDSEHSAIYQCIMGQDRKSLRKVILTASGGPFLDTPLDELDKVTVEDALKHPIWRMGKKITIDSATMMNKGLEMIEAYFLFDLRAEQIDVVIHREGIVHSMVEFKDGAIIAQMGLSDMRIPIAFALSYPERLKLENLSLNFTIPFNISFQPPDYRRFPLLKLAREILTEEKDHLFIGLNTANELAVKAFLSGRIKFTQIERIVSSVIETLPYREIREIGDVLEYTNTVKELTTHLLQKL